MAINWFPGHMKKTKEMIVNNLKLVDVCIELLDARIPQSSKNPIFDELIVNKPRLIVLNKSDLADEAHLKAWCNFYERENTMAVPMSCVNSRGVDRLISEIQAIYKEKKDLVSANTASLEAEQNIPHNAIDRRSVMDLRPIRIMIIGIPNVGKSTLINRLVGKNVTRTENRPGVTKGKQWIRIRDDISLFDTPGVLWPKIEEDLVGYKLAITGSIKDTILNVEDIAHKFIELIMPEYNHLLEQRYGIEIGDKNAAEVMEAIAIKRGTILSKNEVDYFRVSNLILDEFRKGKLGRINLD